ncbi:MAG: 50S ribosomal protein L25 [Alphaproteobacteria bacterium]|nr:50S ribosomal protein L25 [Rickettsiales bacterium]
MSEFNYKLEVEPRNAFGKVLVAKLRLSGFIPAVVYSRFEKGKSDNISILASDANMVVSDYQAKSRLLELVLDGKVRKVLLKSVDFDPVTDLPVHFDFMEVELGDVVTVSLPVRVIHADKSVGVKRGGDIIILRYNVPVAIKVSKNPSEILVDVADSVIGSRYKLSNAIVPEDAVIGQDLLIVKVVGRRSGAKVGNDEAGGDPADKQNESTEQKSS